jgi:hypothetical protein
MCERGAIIAILVAFLSVVGFLSESGGQPASVQKVEDFSSFKEGSFPEGWKFRGGDGSDIYRVKSNHETYLEAHAVNSAVAIAKKFAYELNAYPHLKGQWRVVKLP